MHYSFKLKIPAKLSKPHTKFEDLCVTTLGVHAARIQSPYPAYLARKLSANYVEIYNAQNVAKKTIKLRAVRGTLHHYSLDDAVHFHNATLSKRIRVCKTMSSKLDSKLVEKFKYEICEMLERKVISAKDLEDSFFGSVKFANREEVLSFRVALKYLWEEGVIALQDESKLWNKEMRLYGLTNDLYGGIFLKNIPKEESIGFLIRRYFETYGPATLKDFYWWSGLSKKDCTSQFNEYLSHKLMHKTVQEGLTLFHYISESQIRDEVSDIHEDDRIHIFGWEEAIFKSYYETRFRYVKPAHINAVFNQIGEIKRTIYYRSSIVGIWEVSSLGKPISFELLPGYSKLLNKVRDAFQEYTQRYN